MARHIEKPKRTPDRLIVICQDQLSRNSKFIGSLDPRSDMLWMSENDPDIAGPWIHKQRIVMFLSAMRSFRDWVRKRGIPIHYAELGDGKASESTFGKDLVSAIKAARPRRLACIRPGGFQVLDRIRSIARKHGLPLELAEDEHFYLDTAVFPDWMRDQRRHRLEYFYRTMRRNFGVLMAPGGRPAGGVWNFDPRNRRPLSAADVGRVPQPWRPDEPVLLREIKRLVASRFAKNPGLLDQFSLPITPGQAQELLDDFIINRLPSFGTYEDAMWTDQPLLFHSRLSAPLNLKLLDPREAVKAAVRSYDKGDAPLNSVEGFVRQVLGWREFVHGFYWTKMPEYANMNFFECDDNPVPAFFWNGETAMNCVHQSMRMLLDHGYVHHIHRLMVFGNFCLIAGVHPLRFHQWHMSLYCDGTDWASLPNALGMSQFGDGGMIASKPYCASGNYIDSMSDFCKACRFRPRQSTGDAACPFTVLYWDFLSRNRRKLLSFARLRPQFRHLDRKSRPELTAIRQCADETRKRIYAGRSI